MQRSIAAVASVLVWVLFGGLSSALAHADADEDISPGHATVASEPSIPLAEPLVSSERLEPETVPSAQRIRTCPVPSALLVSGSESLTGAVELVSTGERLWDVGASELRAPASVIKLLTAVAALRSLGADHRFQTTVVRGAEGEVWLVGGGDPTLTRSPGNNYYESESSLNELARQVVDSLATSGSSVTSVHLDDTRYEDFPAWDDTWRTNAWALGYVSPITSLQVDGDRDVPAGRLSARSQDPVGRAGEWFADALVAAGHPDRPPVVSRSGAPAGEVIAQVSSAPVSDLAGLMLLDSDNTLAEVLVREVALARGTNDLGEALLQGAAVPGLDGDSVAIRDGSGLSPLNQVSAEHVLSILREISSDEQLTALMGALPVSGETGSLQQRFSLAGVEAVGVVRAKTGSISGVRSLAGVIDLDDDQLAFTLNVSGTMVSDATRDRIDQLVGALYLCGENLAHWSDEDSDSLRE